MFYCHILVIVVIFTQCIKNIGIFIDDNCDVNTRDGSKVSSDNQCTTRRRISHFSALKISLFLDRIRNLMKYGTYFNCDGTA